jgi:hypothetical protein
MQSVSQLLLGRVSPRIVVCIVFAVAFAVGTALTTGTFLRGAAVLDSANGEPPPVVASQQQLQLLTDDADWLAPVLPSTTLRTSASDMEALVGTANTVVEDHIPSGVAFRFTLLTLASGEQVRVQLPEERAGQVFTGERVKWAVTRSSERSATRASAANGVQQQVFAPT